MITPKPFQALFLILVLCVAGLNTTEPAGATGAAMRDNHRACVHHKKVQHWVDERQIERIGFYRDVFGSQASLAIAGQPPQSYLALRVAADPNSSTYTASRITETESQLPIAERTKCWQPDTKRDVLVEYTLRFQQATVQLGMTENQFLWNAPLPSPQHPEPAVPLTAFGVTRSNGGYSAVLAQDLDLATFSGFVQIVPMPAWLNAADWHRVRVRVSTTHARVEVAQGAHQFTVVADADLPRAPDPMGFEFSVDNEAAPGTFVPVTVPDGVDVGPFDIRTVAHR
ncbi:MAG TPA: hypothetical protein VFO07_02340 [Roseiflexaceae bacterium]|nr:hypothetical protein [Roseiflexaceae bacterium]